ncbi:MAG: phosphatidate cytidylyltransferase [Elusimicrobiota bacterium]
MLLPRVLTIALGIPLALYVIGMGGAPYLVLVIGLTALALHEYALVLWIGGRGIQRVWTVAGGVLVALSVALSARPFPGEGFVPLAITTVVLGALLRELFRREHSLDRAALTVFGALAIGWTLGHLALLRELHPNGKAFTLLLFAAVWATDTFAYCVGMALGRHKLAPTVSPKKTWEGAAAGVAGALAAVWLARSWFLSETLGPATALGLGLLIGVGGQVSDLSQSLVKRASGAKDSAALLPGHGGVFDRMDSFLILAPLFYYVVLVCGV